MRALLLATTGLVGLTLAWPRARRVATSAPRTIPPDAPAEADIANITRKFLLGFVLPLWMAAGVADYLCHCATDIETTAGTKESLIHLVMMMEAAAPTLAGLFLEITSPVLALMIASVLLHSATALWDVSYAVKLREVSPIEQHVHSYLEMVPLMAVSFVCVLHWPQLLGLFGRGKRRPDWSIRWKRKQLPWSDVVPLLTALVALEGAPYLEELARSVVAEPRRRQRLAARSR